MKKSLKGRIAVLPFLVLLAAVALMAASCGSGNSSSESSASTTKLPPGADSSSSSDTTSTTTTQTDQTTSTTQSSTSSSNTTEKTVSLDGVNFTVSKAARADSNEVALTLGARELQGDFLEIELAIDNASGEMVDLADYSFRLYNAALVASQYDDYYGDTGTYGKYVSSHVISASLLNYSSLSTVSYTLRIGEKLEDVFLFFDLNPQSTVKNEAIGKAATNLIIYNTDSGDKVEVSLADFAD